MHKISNNLINNIMIDKIKEKFNPLLFLSSLGAGGIAVGGFILLQYTDFFYGKGLVTFADIEQTAIVLILEAIMVIFALIHAYLTVVYFIGQSAWKKTKAAKEYENNPLVNSGLMAPYVSVFMSMNVIIGVVRYFSETVSSNFQAIMLPAFIFYAFLWLITVYKVLSLLKIAFTKSFDVEKIHFGWLLQPFALAMATVTGSGFAALAHDKVIAGFAAFLVLISATMAIFLTSVKVFSIFKKHLSRDSVLENEFMPTYLIIVPILTLLGISVFRLGHYLNHLYHAPILFTITKLIMIALYAFELWYFAFGLMMLKNYWGDYLSGKFHISQWGLICPFVALGALSAFVYKAYFQHPLFFYVIFVLVLGTVGFYLFLLKRQFKCLASDGEKICEA